MKLRFLIVTACLSGLALLSLVHLQHVHLLEEPTMNDERRHLSVGDTRCLEKIDSPCATDLIDSGLTGEDLMTALLSECGVNFGTEIKLKRGWAIIFVDALIMASMASKMKVCFDKDNGVAFEKKGTPAGWTDEDTLIGWSGRWGWPYNYTETPYEDTCIPFAVNDTIRVNFLPTVQPVSGTQFADNTYAYLGNGAFALERARYTAKLLTVGVPMDADIPDCFTKVDDDGLYLWEDMFGRPYPMVWYDPFIPISSGGRFLLSVLKLTGLAGFFFSDEEPMCE